MSNENIASVINRFLVVYDNEAKQYYKMETAWTDKEVGDVRMNGKVDVKWKVITEHTSGEAALQVANELNNGL